MVCPVVEMVSGFAQQIHTDVWHVLRQWRKIIGVVFVVVMGKIQHSQRSIPMIGSVPLKKNLG